MAASVEKKTVKTTLYIYMIINLYFTSRKRSTKKTKNTDKQYYTIVRYYYTRKYLGV